MKLDLKMGILPAFRNIEVISFTLSETCDDINRQYWHQLKIAILCFDFFHAAKKEALNEKSQMVTTQSKRFSIALYVFQVSTFIDEPTIISHLRLGDRWTLTVKYKN